LIEIGSAVSNFFLPRAIFRPAAWRGLHDRGNRRRLPPLQGAIMKAFAISLGAVALLAGCSGSEEQQMENAIRTGLSNQGEVQQVDLTPQADGNMAGFAVIRGRDGNVVRVNCSANRTQGREFAWRCQAPPRSPQTLENLKNQIRQSYAGDATVLQIELNWQDDDHITGFVRLRDRAGNEGRHVCTATRDHANPGNLPWQCVPEGANAAQPGAQQPAGQDATPTDDGEDGGQ
jgi:hypothetical protein